MSEIYLKVGKLYKLTGTASTVISGASFIHGAYNASNSSAILTIDNNYPIHLAKDGGATFGVPVPFSSVKMDSVSNTGVILYS
jgi:hypothetical protein